MSGRGKLLPTIAKNRRGGGGARVRVIQGRPGGRPEADRREKRSTQVERRLTGGVE